MGFSALRWMFGGAVFLASFLLFLVEPMAAKQLLPVFGGSAAVWVTCLVFFQVALLAAYLYAHWLARSGLGAKLAVVHIGWMLLAVAVATVYAVLPSVTRGGSGSPVMAIFVALGVSIGLPFLMLGATSPLLTVWMGRMETRAGLGGVPYWLYALSNLASLLALAVYPVLIEPYFSLRAQRVAWCAGFVLFALLSAILTWRTRGGVGEREQGADVSAAPVASVWRKLLWVLLPMGAAAQLSAVTSYLTANIAPIPLLWVLPLGVYLITLILAFQFPKIAPRWLVTRLLVVMLAGLGYMLMQVDTTLPIRIGIGFFLLELFVAGLFCHAEAFRLRPERSSETTLFYWLFAAGGALGSFLIGILAPLVFRFNFDLALVFLVTALLALAVNWVGGWGLRLLWGTASVLLLMLAFFIQRVYEHNTPVAVRNFYGSLRVKRLIGYPAAETLTLTNGNIQHGTQILSQELRRVPTTYYAEDSGVGVALKNCCVGRAKTVGVIGLGAGTLAAYGEAEDRFRFYEINPAVVPIAQNVFSYMRESAARIEVVEGDARSSLAAEAAQGFDVLVVDAFSGDAIPLHLLTAEAMSVYRRHLAPGGILAFHISNQHVDLEPEVMRLAEAAGMEAMRVESPINDERGEFAATWMLVTSNAGFFEEPAVAGRVKKARGNAKVRLWTDDYSSLLPVLRW